MFNVFSGEYQNLNLLKRSIDLLKSLKNQNQILEKNFDNLYPSGPKPGKLY